MYSRRFSRFITANGKVQIDPTEISQWLGYNVRVLETKADPIHFASLEQIQEAIEWITKKRTEEFAKQTGIEIEEITISPILV